MKEWKYGGEDIPAGLDPAGKESMLRGMNEAAAESEPVITAAMSINERGRQYEKRGREHERSV